MPGGCLMHVKFDISNLTDTMRPIEVMLIVCDCKYSKEPVQSIKPANTPDVKTQLSFCTVSRADRSRRGADMIIPPAGDNIQLGFLWRCRTCVVPELSRITLYSQRGFFRIH
jgi:hypothetical protein